MAQTPGLRSSVCRQLLPSRMSILPRYGGAERTKFIDSANDSEGKLPSSIMNHILVRTRKGAAKGGSLVDITSLVGHQRRTQEFHDD